MDQADLTAIRVFLETLLHEHDDFSPFGDKESLIKAGRLDSLSVVKLVTFLESDFAVDFTKVEFDPQRFDTAADIAAIIEDTRKMG